VLGPIPPNTLLQRAHQPEGGETDSEAVRETESLLQSTPQVPGREETEPGPMDRGSGAMNLGSGSCECHRQSEVLGGADQTPRTKPPNTKQPEENKTKTAPNQQPKPTPKPLLS